MHRHGTIALTRLAALAALAALVLGTGAGLAEDPARAGTIELAICLDTSNSMDGLIASAKMKLWDIVNDLGRAKPTPVLKVGLYSYGNDGYNPAQGWVRKELDFTTDLDKVNEKLFGLTTRGGTELVARVCRDAVQQLQWSDDPKVLKIIFVCGNEPANQDKEVALPDVAQMAVRKGIVINTIYCGGANAAEATGWKQFADLSEGRYASIDQQRGTVAIATPFDKKLAELGSEINATFCFAGKEAKALAENQTRQDANAAGLSLQAAAARAGSKATGLYRFEQDLVEKCRTDPTFDVKKVKEEELSDELKKMTPEQREAHVKKLVAKREQIQKEIGELNQKREAYIQAELKKNSGKGDQAFDAAVRGALRDQAGKKGIAIPD